MTKKIYTRRAVSRGQGVFSHQIAITSMAGVGGTTLYNRLQKTLAGQGFQFATAGGIMRARAAELGLTIEQFVIHNKAHPEEGHDKWCDEQIAELGRRNKVVVEGRLPHIFMPCAFRVLLICPIPERAGRRQRDNPGSWYKTTLMKMLLRDINDAERYEDRYPGSMWTKHHFDLVVDTSVTTHKETEVRVLDGHAEWWSHQR